MPSPVLHTLEKGYIDVSYSTPQLIPHSTPDGLPYQHLRFQFTIEDGVIEPQDLKGLKLPDAVQWKQGIAIEGKGPIWLYAYLVHECHASTGVGCYDKLEEEREEIRYYLHLPKIAYTLARLPERLRQEDSFKPIRTSLKSPYNAPYFRAIATWLELLTRNTSRS